MRLPLVAIILVVLPQLVEPVKRIFEEFTKLIWRRPRYSQYRCLLFSSARSSCAWCCLHRDEGRQKPQSEYVGRVDGTLTTYTGFLLDLNIPLDALFSRILYYTDTLPCLEMINLGTMGTKIFHLSLPHLSETGDG